MKNPNFNMQWQIFHSKVLSASLESCLLFVFTLGYYLDRLTMYCQWVIGNGFKTQEDVIKTDLKMVGLIIW